MFPQVVQCGKQNAKALQAVANQVIASGAEQSAYNPGRMIMVYVKRSLSSALHSWRHLADCAKSLVINKHGLVLFVRQPVDLTKVPSTALTGESLSLDLSHALHGFKIHLQSVWLWIRCAASRVLDHLANAKLLLAMRAWFQYPSSRADSEHLFADAVRRPPSIGAISVARQASVPKSVGHRSLLGEFLQRFRILASSAKAQFLVYLRKSTALIDKVTIKVQEQEPGLAPFASYNVQALVDFAGFIGHFAKCLLISPILNSLRHQPHGTMTGGLPPGCFGFICIKTKYMTLTSLCQEER